MTQRLNVFQRIVILVWVVALAALAAYAPWTVDQPCKEVSLREGPSESHYPYTWTEFRWFFAPTKWKTEMQVSPTSEGRSGIFQRRPSS